MFIYSITALAPDAEKLAAALNEIDRLYRSALPRIKTPPAVEAMCEEVRKLAKSNLDAEAKEEKAKELGRAIRTIGGGQDNLAAYMRHVGKCIRHIALVNYMEARSPEAREFWGEAYVRTDSMLQGYYGHDGK